MTRLIGLQLASAVLAFAAAVFWFLSARVVIPTAIRQIDFGTLDGQKTEDDLDRLTNGLRRQSRLSAIAAICAGI